MLDWSSLLEHYGYFAVIIGTFFEGETVLLLGAYAVHHHILSFWPLIGSAMIGGFLGDQLYYQLGSKYGYDFIQSRPQWAKKFDQASQLIERYPTLTILFMRFAWGLRTIIPMSFGVKKYSVIRYMLVNVVACFIWAFIVVSVGLQVSHWLHKLWKVLLPEHHSVIIMAAVIACIVIARVVIVLISRNTTRKIEK